jgi:hypothetical protein
MAFSVFNLIRPFKQVVAPDQNASHDDGRQYGKSNVEVRHCKHLSLRAHIKANLKQNRPAVNRAVSIGRCEWASRFVKGQRRGRVTFGKDGR